MTTGIYKLVFSNTTMVYIGQSLNIEYRYTNHINSLKNLRSPKKLQGAYNLYGVPSFHILEICSKEDLNILEIKYITEYDSFNSGFNATLGGENGPNLCGEANGMAQYKEEDYYNVLYFLGFPEYSFTEISEITGVSIRVIQKISTRESHIWLEDYYPEEYQKLKDINSIGRNTAMYNIIRPNSTIVSPEGIEYDVINLAEFANEHGLDRNKLGTVLNNKRHTHRGWHLPGYIARSIVYPDVVSPEGVVYTIEYGKATKFARDHNLDQSALRKLLVKEAKSHKGWKLRNE